MNKSSLKGKAILSVGTGEDQNFRFLLAKSCDVESLYIATDISYEGLVLNRSRNLHENSLYVLCSADHELPFPDNAVDILCYFGILHHTRNKSNNIKKDTRLVREGGYIVLVEAIDRPTLQVSSLPEAETSAHEGQISRESLLTQLRSSAGFEVVFIREEATPFLTGMMRFFSKVLVAHKRLFLFALCSDIFISKTIGRIVPFFRPGEMQVLAKRDATR